VRGWKNWEANWEAKESNWETIGRQKKAGVTILISDKTDLKIMTKGSIQEKDITIVNIYAPNIGAPQYIRQTLTDIKGEIDSNTIRVGDFNTPLTSMNGSSKQKINKEAQVLNDTVFLDYIGSFNICCKSVLVVLSSLNFCLSEILFISPSILNEILASYVILVVDFFLSVF